MEGQGLASEDGQQEGEEQGRITKFILQKTNYKDQNAQSTWRLLLKK